MHCSTGMTRGKTEAVNLVLIETMLFPECDLELCLLDQNSQVFKVALLTYPRLICIQPISPVSSHLPIDDPDQHRFFS